MNNHSVQVLPMRKRCEVINQTLRIRLDTILPMVMRETGFDMWLIICLEDNYDPVFLSMIPMDTWAPILQMLVFFDRGENGIERINLSRTGTHDLYDVPYKVEHPDAQWGWLREVIEERNPNRIAINQGDVIWASDGLSATLKDKLIETLPQKYASRLESGEDLCRRWFETLTDRELEIYPHVVSVAHSIQKEIASRKYITPGITTLEDIRWAFWQLCTDLGLELTVPFPSYKLHRSNKRKELFGPQDDVIRRGDLVYWDVGIHYLRLHTDNAEWAYILKEGETDAPDGMKKNMEDGLRLQDIYIGEFQQGRTGNEILRSALEKARQEGLNNPRIYSHCTGLLLHEPGPLIGHPFEQENWTGRGDVELNYNTTFVAEVSIDGIVPEWGDQIIRMPFEEQIMFTKDGVKFIDGRQESFHLV